MYNSTNDVIEEEEEMELMLRTLQYILIKLMKEN
jgi:hypothetical protein